jgi:hypothetical protein
MEENNKIINENSKKILIFAGTSQDDAEELKDAA